MVTSPVAVPPKLSVTVKDTSDVTARFKLANSVMLKQLAPRLL